MKKDDETLEFNDLSLDEKDFMCRYRNDTIFRALVDKVIYDRYGSHVFDEARKRDKAGQKRKMMNDKG